MADDSSRVLPGRLLALGKLAGSFFPALGRALPIAVPTGLLAYEALRAVLGRSEGVPAVPLDDAYIHFQYARSFAMGTPLVYAPGAPPVAGATSLLWPLALAVPYALGLREQSIVWAAWVFGFVALGLLAHEARRAAERLCGPICAAGAALLVLVFGPNLWFAASGMEVVPLAWLLLRAARRGAEYCEAAPNAPSARELAVLGLLLPLLRPEGALGSLLVAVALLAGPRRRARPVALIALSGLALPMLVNALLAGDATSTTARAKWLPLSPYASASSLFTAFADYAELLVTKLLDGQVWSALFLPRGSSPFLLAALVALPLAGFRRGVPARGLLLAALALGVLIPGSYDCPLCNRLRYLWPFLPPFFVGGAALCELVADFLAERRGELRAAGALLVGFFAGALGGHLPYALDDLAESARAISDQQVALGAWARDSLPRSARIGVNDTGAIAYFSGRQTFDIVGLTTRGEARYWAGGSGARFEHYERLGPARLPSHFIVYPEWFALDDLLGEELTARAVPGATILGGERMVAYRADYSRLGSGERPDPELADGRALVDRVDVADLDSEAAHEFALFDADQRSSVVLGDATRLDGGRAGRTRDSFLLDVHPGGAIAVRAAAEAPITLELTLQGRRLTLPLPAASWHEARLDLPAEIRRGRARIEVAAGGEEFTSLHYFSLAARK